MSLERMYIFFFSGEICFWAAAVSEQLLKMNKADDTPCNMQGEFKFKQSREVVLAHFDGYVLKGDTGFWKIYMPLWCCYTGKMGVTEK